MNTGGSNFFARADFRQLGNCFGISGGILRIHDFDEKREKIR